MGKDGGSSQGFGRVSSHTRPSPYSPLHFRGSLPTSQRDSSGPAVEQPRRPGARRAVFAAAIVAALIAGVSYLALSRPTALPAPRAAATPVPAPAAAAVQDEEARRLARSAGNVAPR